MYYFLIFNYLLFIEMEQYIQLLHSWFNPLDLLTSPTDIYLD